MGALQRLRLQIKLLRLCGPVPIRFPKTEQEGWRQWRAENGEEPKLFIIGGNDYGKMYGKDDVYGG